MCALSYLYNLYTETEDFLLLLLLLLFHRLIFKYRLIQCKLCCSHTWFFNLATFSWNHNFRNYRETFQLECQLTKLGCIPSSDKYLNICASYVAPVNVMSWIPISLINIYSYLEINVIIISPCQLHFISPGANQIWQISSMQ